MNITTLNIATFGLVYTTVTGSTGLFHSTQLGHFVECRALVGACGC